MPESAAPVAILHNHGFWVGYSSRRRDPAWVVYRAEPPGGGRLPPRPKFRADKRVAGAPGADAISGYYDRGHLAPNYLISKLYGPQAQRQTFLMTNVAPQRPRLNQLLWQRIEEAEADAMAPRWGSLWVQTGPIFGAPHRRLPSGIEIPVAFYRLWLRRDGNDHPHVLALRVPQSVHGDEALTAFLTTVDAVEAATGLDFYPALPDALERRLESRVADPDDWGFAAVACQPARYRDDWQGRGGMTLDFDRCGGKP